MYAKQICCRAIFCSALPSDLISCLKHCGSHIKLLCENWDCNFYRNVHTPSSWHSQPFHQIKNRGYRVCFRALVTNEKYGSLVNLRLSIQSVMVVSSSTPIGYTHITGLQQVPLFDYYYSTFSKDTRLDKNGKKEQVRRNKEMSCMHPEDQTCRKWSLSAVATLLEEVIRTFPLSSFSVNSLRRPWFPSREKASFRWWYDKPLVTIFSTI